jgi:SynChlorMet cassette protein ScmC
VCNINYHDMQTLSRYRLVLQDESGWTLSFAADIQEWGRKLAQIMRLQDGAPDGLPEIRFQAVNRTETRDWIEGQHREYNFGGLRIYQRGADPGFWCEVDNSGDSEEIEISNMWNAMNPIYLHSIRRGGLPFHAALLARDGQGVLLAASGNMGKSTCARRIPRPWTALGDDEALIVRNQRQARYLAHPFPTWCDYLWRRAVNTWDVQAAVPLTAIFFFYRSVTDVCESFGQGQTVGWITESANQVARRIWSRLSADQQTELKTLIFQNACELAKTVPAFRLGVNLHGRFWEVIERTLDSNGKEVSVYEMGRSTVSSTQWTR